MSWRSLLIVIPLLAILAAAGWLAYAAWTSVPGPPMPTSGYVAMWLGIVFSAVVGCGLMALVFISSRHGYDDAAHDDPRHEQERPEN